MSKRSTVSNMWTLRLQQGALGVHRRFSKSQHMCFSLLLLQIVVELSGSYRAAALSPRCRKCLETSLSWLPLSRDQTAAAGSLPSQTQPAPSQVHSHPFYLL